MKRSGSSILLLMTLLTVLALPAAAITDIVVPVDTIVRSAEGELTVLAVVVVDAEFVGASCLVSAQGENNASVHPNNDIIVASGSDFVVLFDVEGVGGGITNAAGALVLGETIVLTLRMGGDLVFSGGLTVTVDCQPGGTTTTAPGSTTSTVAETTTTTVPATTSTTVLDSTTTSQPKQESTTTAAQEDSTTTTVPADSSTTTDVAVLGTRVYASDELPATGIATEVAAAVAFMLIATGFFLKRMVTARQR